MPTMSQVCGYYIYMCVCVRDCICGYVFPLDVSRSALALLMSTAGVASCNWEPRSSCTQNCVAQSSGSAVAVAPLGAAASVHFTPSFTAPRL